MAPSFKPLVPTVLTSPSACFFYKKDQRANFGIFLTKLARCPFSEIKFSHLYNYLLDLCTCIFYVKLCQKCLCCHTLDLRSEGWTSRLARIVCSLICIYRTNVQFLLVLCVAQSSTTTVIRIYIFSLFVYLFVYLFVCCLIFFLFVSYCNRCSNL